MNYEITDQMLTDAANRQPVPFDSHAVIRQLMRDNSRAYVHDLYLHYEAGHSDPIHTLHSAIGTRLAGLGTLVPTQKVRSMNVRGQETENQEWRR